MRKDSDKEDRRRENAGGSSDNPALKKEFQAA